MNLKIKPFSFWKDMPRERQRRIEVITGLVMAAFALFTLIAIVSYLFTWRADQSLDGYEKAMDQDVPVSNLAGKLGFKWSYLLVCKWFGLGSLALVVILGVISLRLLFGKRSYSIVRVLILSVTGALVASFVFAFVSKVAGLDTTFGSGLGGGCGDVMVSFMDNLVGSLLTFCILAILVVLWLLFASRKFSEKLSADPDRPARKKEKKEKKERKTFTWIKDAVKKEMEAAESSEEPEDQEAVEVSDPLPEIEVETMPGSETEAETEPEPELEIEQEKSPEPEAETHAEGMDGNIDIVEPEPLSTDVDEPLPRIDVRSELEKYEFPSLDILGDYEDKRQSVSQEELMRNNYKIRATLRNYKIEVENVKAVVGPTVTLYKVFPAPGVKIASIKGRQEDIGMALKAKGVRVVTLEDSVGIEVANDNPSMVPLKAMLNDEKFRNTKAELPVAIGYTITQDVKIFDLADAPHLLVAGATKQGKSVGLNVLIASLLYSKHPSELKFVFIDPKMVEFSAYAGLLKHYLAVLPDAASEEQERENAIAKNPKQAEAVLRSLCIEMDERYTLMSKALVSKVTLYNEKYKDRYLLPTEGHRYMPYIVVVVDEYADLTMTVGASGDSKAMARSISTSIVRLAQKGRAAGIHVVLATQRPSVDVITGLIKSNFPTRIAFRVFSSIDSRTILDTPGAEKLIGNGDMIYLSGADMERVQCAFISGKEINAMSKFISQQDGYKQCYNTPYYLPMPESEDGGDGGGMIDMKSLDPRFEEAARMVVTTQKGSTSDIQRRLGMGYARSGKVMDQLQAAGIVGPQEGSKPRQVLVSDLAELEEIIQAYKNAIE
ncbi:MAG: DNA translocase FtsK 4TM domain-containing protein [Bacteroidales bacterium]|nr:DNA translocase FtsK 4TM domain-containing protein [Bacteroidales bacterium]